MLPNQYLNVTVFDCIAQAFPLTCKLLLCCRDNIHALYIIHDFTLKFLFSLYNLDYRIDIIMWYIFFYILIVVVIIVLNLPCDLRALCGSQYALNNFICFIIVIVIISLLLLHAAQVNYVCLRSALFTCT